MYCMYIVLMKEIFPENFIKIRVGEILPPSGGALPPAKFRKVSFPSRKLFFYQYKNPLQITTNRFWNFPSFSFYQ